MAISQQKVLFLVQNIYVHTSVNNLFQCNNELFKQWPTFPRREDNKILCVYRVDFAEFGVLRTNIFVQFKLHCLIVSSLNPPSANLNRSYLFNPFQLVLISAASIVCLRDFACAIIFHGQLLNGHVSSSELTENKFWIITRNTKFDLK